MVARNLLVAGSAALALLAALAAPAARATVQDAATIDGPSADILELGGVAMAEDGTGGLVYRKRVDGVSHVFAAQFTGGAWQSPQRVDAGQRFDSTFPVIGAADDGELVVVWVQEFGTGTDRLYSSVLGPGARRFQAPTLIDAGIGEATATYPSIALNRGGAGYLAYSVVTSDQANAALPQGYVTVERRMARFSGQYWTGLGTSFARQPSVPVRQPTAATAPKVAIDTTGNGIVAWQEPDDQFVDRIWARRVFGGSLGVVDQVSASDGAASLAGADAFSLDTAGFGAGAIAYRQLPGAGETRAHDLVALVPQTFATDAAKFAAPAAVDAGVSAPGAPSVAVDADGSFATGFTDGVAAMAARGTDRGVQAPQRIDAGSSTATGDPGVELAGSGAAVVAFGVDVNRRPGVEVHELRADGVPQQRTVSAARGGIVGSLELAGSGLGDALIGFLQGSGATTQIGATAVDAPPDEFGVQTPIDWVATPTVKLRWDPAAHAIGGVTYTVTVDDQTVAEGLTGTSYTLKGDDVGSGRQTVAVIATDSGGQETTSDPAELKVDRSPPTVTVRRRGRRTVVVTLTDRQSGLDAASTRLRIGEGKTLTGQRRYALRLTRAGRFKAFVRGRDKAGNRVRTVRTVRTR